MPAVIEPDADDLVGIGHARPERGLVGRYEVAVGSGAGAGLVGETLEAVDIALAVEHRVDGGGRALAEILLGGDHVEHAAVRAQPEPEAFRSSQRGENHALRKLARFACARDALRDGIGRRRHARGGCHGGNAGEARGLEERSSVMISWQPPC